MRFFSLHLRCRKWIVFTLMILFTWCDFLCMRCSGVCDVTHEVLYPFCVIVMCDSNINTFQIASIPITLCEQLHKIACKRTLSHAEQIAPCERALSSCKGLRLRLRFFIVMNGLQGIQCKCCCDNDIKFHTAH